MGERGWGPGVGCHGELPERRTRLFGRAGAVDELAGLVGSERLLSLVGPPGAGKTRLAVEVAARVAPRFAGGVRFVDLAALDAATGTATAASAPTGTGTAALAATQAAIANAVGDAVGVAEEPGRPIEEVLVGALTGLEPVLLVLDNCEHLVAGAAALAQRLVEACPPVSLLATSRAALGVPSERVCPVPRLDQAAAADLFADRARALWHDRPPFGVDPGGGGDDDRAVVEAICAVLDGIPLAVELTAAWTRVVTPRQILDRLTGASPELPGRCHGHDPRHDTMAASVDWSYRLLPTGAQRLFEQLSVFAGGFDLAAVEAVTGGDANGDGDLLARLTLLVDNSLVLVENVSAGRMRYRMLEPVRQHAARLLATNGDEDRARRRHYDHYLRVGRAYTPWEEQAGGGDQIRWAQLAPDEGNLRAALAWAGRQPSDLALRLVVAWAAYLSPAGRINDGVRWLEDALARGTDDPRLRAQGLIECGYLLWRQGAYAAARQRLAEALDLARSLHEPTLEADVLILESAAAFSDGDLDHAAWCSQEAVVLYGSTSDGGEDSSSHRMNVGLAELRRTRASMAHAWTHYARGDSAAGDELMRAALVTNERYANPTVLAYANSGLAYGAALAGDSRAQRDHLVAAAAGIADGAIVERADWLGMAGLLAVRERRFHAAVRLLGGAETFGRRRGGAQTPAQLRERFSAEYARVFIEEVSGVADRLLSEGQRMGWDELVAEGLAEPGVDPSPLTRREREIADLVAEGLTNAAIAVKLVISRRTVDSHVDHIKRKLDLKSRSEIIVWVLRSGAER